MSYVMKVLGLINGAPTAFDGEYVVAYDPGRSGTEPGTGQPMLCYLLTTPSRASATRFDDPLGLWRSVDPHNPIRPDGRPNRPLTAFNVEIEDA